MFTARSPDGYAPLADYGLIGDGTTAALVARDGSIDWLCLPRFDSAAVFCGILDQARGGRWAVTPRDFVGARQRYDDDSGVLTTELRVRDGHVLVTDALTLRSGADLTEDAPAHRGELLRLIEAVGTEVTIDIRFEPRGATQASRVASGLDLELGDHPDLDLHLSASWPLDGLVTSVTLRPGERRWMRLRWAPGSRRDGDFDPLATVERTRRVWRRWCESIDYDGPRRDMVRRSAITLKLLDYVANGAIVAAPTSSLPESIGGVRNWDYRFAWVRDAAFSVYAFRRIGLVMEAQGFLGWVLDALERSGRARVLYDLDGHEAPPEHVDSELEGYCGSRPVRWGNGARDQEQHDALGEIVDCAYQWAAHGGALPEPLWTRLVDVIEEAARVWRTPDHGIWEVRSDQAVFTYSAAMCQVALERGARIVGRFGVRGDAARWREESRRITDAILREAWDPERNAITATLGGPRPLDASVLSLPMRRVVPADDPRMVSTTAAIVSELGAGDGLLYRYRPDSLVDGLEGDEGAFLLCSFWLVDNLAYQGRLDEALALYDSLCDRGGELGLLPEQIDPTTGAFLGNYPQAFSHVGVVSSGVNLARHLERRGREQGGT